MLTFIIIVLAASIAAIYARHNHFASAFDVLKPLTTIVIIAFALLNFSGSNYDYFITIGLVFCLLGDIALLREKYFVHGLASFLIAHVLFTLGIIELEGFQNNIPLAIILLLVGVFYYRFLSKNLKELAIPVLVYFCVIILMMYQAIALPLNASNPPPLFPLLALASVLFAFSDSIIAYTKFVKPLKYGEVIILSTYWTSVSLFSLSLFLN